MLSCASIQKLERYGQLGLKRSSVEDYVASSLKDPKRANIYALTHLPTWQECLDAIHAAGTSGHSIGAAPVVVSDALVYAVSFATSLVSQHLFLRQQAQLCGCGVGESGLSVDVAAAKRDPSAQQQQGGADSAKQVFHADSSSGLPAAELVALLKCVVVQVARQSNRGERAPTSPSKEKDDEEAAVSRSAGGVRIAESKELLQALSHLTSSLFAMLVFALCVRLNALIRAAATAGRAKENGGEEEEVEAMRIWRDGLVLLSASTRLLRRVSASQQHSGNSNNNSNNNNSDDPLITVRSINTLVRQFTAKQQRQREQRAEGTTDGQGLAIPQAVLTLEKSEVLQTFPVLRVLLGYTNVVAASSVAGVPVAGGFTFFEGFSLIQKLALLHAALPDVAALLRETTSRKEDAQRDERGHASEATSFVEQRTQQLLKDLFSSRACNKATRYVVYFRGDDVKMMQSRLSQPSQYALHTFTTTPPVDPFFVDAVAAALKTSAPPAATGEVRATLWQMQQRSFYALLFAQWIATAPLFFEAFCSDPSWTAFAQEQRRTALLRQAHDRRHTREDRRQRKRVKQDVRSGSGSVSEKSDTDAVNGDGTDDDDVASTFSGTTNGQLSLALSLETSRGALSTASRVSLLSTLSKRSAATYMSFLSVLRPTEDGDGDGTRANDSAKFHESADGNTNLPLILLEEIVLGLHRFMEAFPVEALDDVDLRALCWQSVGRLFAFVQHSISLDSSFTAGEGKVVGGGRGVPMGLFNLGTDLRYNRGLGYESLGLLFAKVIAPQFESEQETGDAEAAPLPAGRASVWKADRPSTRRCVEAALSRCLAAYEEVAPQVVDMNLPVILRIAARTVAADAAPLPSAVTPTSLTSANVLYTFLASIVVRLGKCNQLPVLLEALISSVDAAGGGGSDGRGPPRSASVDHDEEREDVAALHVVFSHPLCRAALVRASGLSMDPENLLEQLLKSVAVWSLGGSDAEGQAESRDPLHVVFALKLIATVLEGLQPTSMTSSTVLERCTELELLLSAFAQKHLYVSLSDEEHRASGSGFFRVDGALRPKVRRQLWLHTLYAIYRCRMVAASCFHDLGMQSVKDYLSLLNETVWQVHRHVGALILSTADEAEDGPAPSAASSVAGGFGFDDLAGQLSATTHMALPPFVHIRALLPMLALQRLVLARSVSTVLGCELSPLAEAQGLAHAVLDAILACCTSTDTGSGAGASPVSAAQVTMRFLNAISEEEWKCLALFAKKKRLRATLVALLKWHFACQTHGDQQQSQPQARSYAAPVWWTRCLRYAGGTALRATTDSFLAFSADDVAAMAEAEEGSAEASREQELLSMLAALQYTYSVVGHVPYWPLLADHASAWIEAVSSRHKGAESPVVSALLVFLHFTLSYEGTSGEVIRKTLLLHEGNASSALQKRKGLSRLYMEEIGVLAKRKTDREGKSEQEEKEKEKEEEEEEEEVYLDDELADFADELGRFTRRVFSASFLPVLFSFDAERATAMHLLGFLYHTAVWTCRAAWREGRYRREGVEATNGTAAVFLPAVAGFFRTQVTAAAASPQRGSRGDSAYVSLLCFLQALGELSAGTSALAPGLPHKSSKNTRKESGEKEAVAVAFDFDRTTESCWLFTLRHCIAQAASAADAAVTLTPALLRCLTTLYTALLMNHRRSRGKGVSDGEAVSSFVRLLLKHCDKDVEGGGDEEAGLRETLFRLFAPSAAAKDGQHSEVAASVSALSSLLLRRQQQQRRPLDGEPRPNCTPGMVALWVMYSLFVEGVAHGEKRQREQDKGGTLSVGKQKAAAAALVTHVLARIPELIVLQEKPEEQRDVLLSIVGDLDSEPPLRCGEPHGRSAESALCARNFINGPSSFPLLATFCQQALDATVSALALLGVDAAPPLLLAYTHSLLSQCISSASCCSAPVASAHDGRHLLVIAARAIYRLVRIPCAHVNTSLKLRIVALLSLSTSAPYLFSPGVRAGGHGGDSLYALLLALLQVPVVTASMEADEASIDIAWSFVALLLEESNRTSKGNADSSSSSSSKQQHHEEGTTVLGDGSVAGPKLGESFGDTTGSFVLSQAEVMSVLNLLMHTWLPHGVLWRRSGQLPTLLNALFEAVLLGVRDGRYERRVLSHLSSLFRLLVKCGVDATEEEEEEEQPITEQASGDKKNNNDNNNKDAHGTRLTTGPEKTAEKDGGQRRSPSRTPVQTPSRTAVVSYETRVLCLAAIVSDMFQLSRHYITVFTVHSNDLDYIARDFLRALSRHHLPSVKAAPIAFHEGVTIRPVAPSPATFADLVYTCVGDEECKALLRQAALRLDEEVVEQGGGGSKEGLVERRRIFNVDV